MSDSLFSSVLDLVGNLLLWIAKGIFAVLSILASGLLAGLKGLFRYGRAQRQDRIISDMATRVSRARVENTRLKKLGEGALSVLPAGHPEKSGIRQLIDYCNHWEPILQSMEQDLQADLLNPASQEMILRKYKNPFENIRKLQYAYTEASLQQLIDQYGGDNRYIRTLLEYAGATPGAQCGNTWEYTCGGSQGKLQFDKEQNQITIEMLPQTPCQVNPDAKFVASSDSSTLRFGADRRLRLYNRVAADSIDHYDIKEYFGYLERLLHKPEINPAAGKTTLTAREAIDLEDFSYDKLKCFRKIAPPPPDVVSDSEKNHDGKMRWATFADLEAAGMLKNEGLILGRMGYGTYLTTGSDYDSHILTIASTGSGKGVGVVIPNLIRYPGSVICLDPKGENYITTASHRAKKGSRVFYIDPWEVIDEARQLKGFSPVGTKATINPLDFVAPVDEGLYESCRSMASSMILRENDRDAYFYDNAEELLARLIAFVAVVYSWGEKSRDGEELRNLLTVRRLLMEPVEVLHKRVLTYCRLAGNPYRIIGDLEKYLRNLAANQQKSQLDVYSFARTATSFMQSAYVSRVLEKSSFDILDIKKTNLSIYLVLKSSMITEVQAANKPFIRLLAATCFKGIQSPVKPRHKVLFMMDEVAQLDKMNTLINYLTLYRSYGLIVWTIWQSVAQIRSLYAEQADIILDNCNVLQFFGVNSMETAELVSKYAGKTTAIKRSHTFTRSHTAGNTYTSGSSGSSTSGTSDSDSSGSGSTYSGFNYSFNTSSSSTRTTTNSYTHSYNYARSISKSLTLSEGETATLETVNLIQPAEVQAANAYDVQFVFYRSRCPHGILCGKIKYYEEYEFFGEYTENVTRK